MQNDLGFDYEKINGQTIVSIFGSGFFTSSDGGVSFDAIELALGNCKLLISVNPDTDEIYCRLVDKYFYLENSQEVLVMKNYVGCELGWLWLANNYLGYRDMVAISFDGIEPNIAMVGVASKISLSRFERLKA